MSITTSSPLLQPDDTRARYVRFGRMNGNFVEFSFAVGSPDLMVELVMPLASYEDFCRTNQVTHLTPAEELAMDIDQAKWRYGQPGLPD